MDLRTASVAGQIKDSKSCWESHTYCESVEMQFGLLCLSLQRFGERRRKVARLTLDVQPLISASALACMTQDLLLRFALQELLLGKLSTHASVALLEGFVPIVSERALQELLHEHSEGFPLHFVQHYLQAPYDVLRMLC